MLSVASKVWNGVPNKCPRNPALRCAGVETMHHPLHDILDLSEEEHPANPHLVGDLTATYPEVWDKEHGRKVISNYPNQGVCRSSLNCYNYRVNCRATAVVCNFTHTGA